METRIDIAMWITNEGELITGKSHEQIAIETFNCVLKDFEVSQLLNKGFIRIRQMDDVISCQFSENVSCRALKRFKIFCLNFIRKSEGFSVIVPDSFIKFSSISANDDLRCFFDLCQKQRKCKKCNNCLFEIG